MPLPCSRLVSNQTVTAQVAQDNESDRQAVNPVKCGAELGHTPYNDIPTCSLVIEGTQPVSCILDSGAVTSIVSDQFVESCEQRSGTVCVR